MGKFAREMARQRGTTSCGDGQTSRARVEIFSRERESVKWLDNLGETVKVKGIFVRTEARRKSFAWAFNVSRCLYMYIGTRRKIPFICMKMKMKKMMIVMGSPASRRNGMPKKICQNYWVR